MAIPDLPHCARVSERCPQCGGVAEVSFGQTLLHDGVAWWESYRCGQCSCTIEADGRSDMPPERRNILLERFGAWTLEVGSKPSTALLASLRKELGWSIAQLGEARSRLPFVPVVGTRCEMEGLARNLRKSAASHDEIRVIHAAEEPRGGGTVPCVF